MSSSSIDHGDDEIERSLNGLYFRRRTWQADQNGKAKDFFMAPRPLLHDATVSVQARFIYMLIMDECQRLSTPTVRYTYGQITRYTGIKHHTTIANYLDELEQLGWLAVSGDAARASTNTERWYTPTPPDELEYKEVLTPSYVEGSRSRQRQRQQLPGRVSIIDGGDGQGMTAMGRELTRNESELDIQGINTKLSEQYNSYTLGADEKTPTTSGLLLEKNLQTDPVVQDQAYGHAEQGSIPAVANTEDHCREAPGKTSSMSASTSLRSVGRQTSNGYGRSSEIDTDLRDDLETRLTQLRRQIIALDAEAQDARAAGDEQGHDRINNQIRELNAATALLRKNLG